MIPLPLYRQGGKDHPSACGLPASLPFDRWLPSLLFLLLSCAVLFIPGGEKTVSLRLVFTAIVLEALPFMLVGALVGGVIEVLLPRERLLAWLPRREWLAVSLAGVMGICFPVCECAVVPVVRRLVGKGLPAGAAVTFLLAAPLVNPLVAASTALAYRLDWEVVGLRLGLGYGIAVVIGLLLARIDRRQAIFPPFLAQEPGDTPVCGASGGGLEQGKTAAAAIAGDRFDALLLRLGQIFRHAADDILTVGHYLVIGAFVAALAQSLLDRSVTLRLAEIPLLACGGMMLLAIALNLCSETDAFIAASFGLLLPLSAQLAFMLTGPMLDLKLLLMYRSLLRRHAIVWLACLVPAMVLTVCAGLELWQGLGR